MVVYMNKGLLGKFIYHECTGGLRQYIYVLPIYVICVNSMRQKKMKPPMKVKENFQNIISVLKQKTQVDTLTTSKRTHP